ncbi:hypothetical protein ACM6PT_05940, partial [Klebsiella pneumoniae]
MSSLYQSMIAVIEQSITPLAGRLGQQKYVIAIRDGFTAALPFMERVCTKFSAVRSPV